MPAATRSTPTTASPAVELLNTMTTATASMETTMNEIVTMLCDREAVLAIATDSVLASDALEAMQTLGALVTRVEARLTQVGELSQTIDRLADPMLLENVR